MRKQAGFNLIELLIVVAIIGILGSLAYSGYSGYMVDARRGEAMATLMDISQAQEKYYLDEQKYAADRATLNLDQYTSGGHYEITVEAEQVNGLWSYEALAQAKSGGAQAGDTACVDMRILSNGRRTPTECWE